MNTVLGLVQSTLFGGIVLLLAVGLNTRLSEMSAEKALSVSTQESVALTASIIEDDFRKIGYGAGPSPITSADTCGNITFKAVVDSSGGAVKTIQYQVSTASEGHRRLTRKVNGGTTVIYSHVDSLGLTYYDKLGNRMPGSALVLENIGSLKVRMFLRGESELKPSDPAGHRADAVFWERKIAPKNIQSSL